MPLLIKSIPSNLSSLNSFSSLVQFVPFYQAFSYMLPYNHSLSHVFKSCLLDYTKGPWQQDCLLSMQITGHLLNMVNCYSRESRFFEHEPPVSLLGLAINLSSKNQPNKNPLLFNNLEPRFPHLLNEDNDACITGLLRHSNEMCWGHFLNHKTFYRGWHYHFKKWWQTV